MYNKMQLCRDVAKVSGVSQEKTRDVLNAAIKILQARLANGEDYIIIKGFGTLYTVDIIGKETYDFQTGDKTVMKPYRTINYKPSISIKRALKRGFNHDAER